MPDYRDFLNLIHGPVPPRPLPCIWDFFPCHAGAVGSVPNFLDYYFDVDEKLRLQATLQNLLPKAGLSGLMPLVLTQREIMRRKLKAKGREMERWGMSMGAAPYPLDGYRHDSGNHPRESAGDDRDCSWERKVIT